MTNIFLSQEIEKLQKNCDTNKEDLLRICELVTYLAATKEITLDAATTLFNRLINLSP